MKKKKYMGKHPMKPVSGPGPGPGPGSDSELENQSVNEPANETTNEAVEPSRFSLTSLWGRVSKRLPSKGTLKKAFTPAALGVALGVAAKVAAMATTAAVLGPIFAATAGVGMTTYGFIKDYKEDELYESSLISLKIIGKNTP
jgi:hypothetical protein